MKEKQQRKKRMIFLIAILVVAVIAVKWIKGTSTYLRIGYIEKEDPNSWSGSYLFLTGTMQKMISPKTKEDVLYIAVETTSGTISIQIKDSSGGIIFDRDRIGTEDFVIEVSESITIQIKANQHRGSFFVEFGTGYKPAEVSSGEIFLYGERHSAEGILKKEIQIWDSYYKEGMRDLFVELPYYTAEFLNIWMQSEEDTILNEIYQDWNGTAVYTEEVKQFYQEIKRNYPETVFHGTDVGHQYNTTGSRYLEYLKLQGEENSDEYKLAEDAVKQGKYYYEHSDPIYRENCMTENFIREFERLNGASVMGIYGAAHTDKEGMDDATHTIPCMANQLYQRYGTLVKSEDLTEFAYLREPLEIGTIAIAGKEYQASYFGKADLSAFFPEYQYREFWRVENAYADWKESGTTGNVLPYDNYPMIVEEGQIFVIDYIKADGTVERTYYRSDGNTWQGVPTTEEFLVEEGTELE